MLHTLHEMDSWMHKYMGPDAVASEPAPAAEEASAATEALSAAKL